MVLRLLYVMGSRVHLGKIDRYIFMDASQDTGPHNFKSSDDHKNVQEFL